MHIFEYYEVHPPQGGDTCYEVVDGIIFYFTKNGKTEQTKTGQFYIEHSTGRVWETEDYTHGRKCFGILHSINGPAIIHQDGKKEWWSYGQRHREYEPAVIYPGGMKEWWYKGKRHRLNGPAVMHQDGHHTWFVEGQYIAKGQYVYDRIKWDLIKANVENIQVLGCTTPEQQEYIIQLRPDLINQIDNLHPKLKEKYSHELSLSGVEI